MREDMTRILFIDSQPVMRRGLRATLEEALPCCEIGEAGDALSGLAMLQQQAWDIAIVELALPDMDWMDLLKRMRLRAPHMPILVFCRYREEEYGTRCLKLGASGYLSKRASPEELVYAVRQVIAHGVYLSPRVSERLALETTGLLAADPHEALSNREFEVFRLLSAGETVSDIAEQLRLSVKTVSTYRKRILTKLGMKSNAELTHYAASIGLLD